MLPESKPSYLSRYGDLEALILFTIGVGHIHIAFLQDILAERRCFVSEKLCTSRKPDMTHNTNKERSQAATCR
jgi:hypothetical protein